MKKFIVIYKATGEVWGKLSKATPEEHKKGMEKWMQWAKKCGEGLVDMGSPLGNGQLVNKDGSSRVEPNILGYSVLQAEDMDRALAMLKDHPHLAWEDSCTIEVHECMPMPE